MSIRTASIPPTPATATLRSRRQRSAPRAAAPTPSPAAAPHPVPAADPALDEALERISDLAARLWAVRSTHRPAAAGWRRRETRCAECGQALPCATLRATG